MFDYMEINNYSYSGLSVWGLKDGECWLLNKFSEIYMGKRLTTTNDKPWVNTYLANNGNDAVGKIGFWGRLHLCCSNDQEEYFFLNDVVSLWFYMCCKDDRTIQVDEI